MLRPRARSNPGAIVYRLVTISDMNRFGNGDGLGVLMLSMMLFCMDFFVLLKVLRSLEGLLTDLKTR